MTTGHGLLCRECLCFNTVPCRHMPLLVHFWALLGFAPCQSLTSSSLRAAVRGRLHFGGWWNAVGTLMETLRPEGAVRRPPFAASTFQKECGFVESEISNSSVSTVFHRPLNIPAKLQSPWTEGPTQKGDLTKNVLLSYLLTWKWPLRDFMSGSPPLFGTARQSLISAASNIFIWRGQKQRSNMFKTKNKRQTK